MVGKVLGQNVAGGFRNAFRNNRINWEELIPFFLKASLMDRSSPEFPEKIWACCGWHPHWERWGHPTSSSSSSAAPSVPHPNTAPCTWPDQTWTSPSDALWIAPLTPSAAVWACGQESAGMGMQALDVHPRCPRIWGSHRVAVEVCFRFDMAYGSN